MSFETESQKPKARSSLMALFGPDASAEAKATTRKAAELSMGDMVQVLNAGKEPTKPIKSEPLNVFSNELHDEIIQQTAVTMDYITSFQWEISSMAEKLCKLSLLDAQTHQGKVGSDTICKWHAADAKLFSRSEVEVYEKRVLLNYLELFKNATRFTGGLEDLAKSAEEENFPLGTKAPIHRLVYIKNCELEQVETSQNDFSEFYAGCSKSIYAVPPAHVIPKLSK